MGGGLRPNISAVPRPETTIRMIPRVFLVAEVMYSSPWNMKKHCRLPISSEDIDIAQKIAEFLQVDIKTITKNVV